jgi:hypothetical protein
LKLEAANCGEILAVPVHERSPGTRGRFDR